MMTNNNTNGHVRKYMSILISVANNHFILLAAQQHVIRRRRLAFIRRFSGLLQVGRTRIALETLVENGLVFIRFEGGDDILRPGFILVLGLDGDDV